MVARRIVSCVGQGFDIEEAGIAKIRDIALELEGLLMKLPISEDCLACSCATIRNMGKSFTKSVEAQSSLYAVPGRYNSIANGFRSFASGGSMLQFCDSRKGREILRCRKNLPSIFELSLITVSSTMAFATGRLAR